MPTAAVFLVCLVVGVTDGDSLTARCEVGRDMQTIKVRLAEIDAPEKAQPFGNRSKQNLADLCFRKEAEVYPVENDKYGRLVARVGCDGIDANAAQVIMGMAWVYDQYATDETLYQYQEEAQAERRGLWAHRNPVEP